MRRPRKLSIPHEIFMRLDDVAYTLDSDNYHALPEEQKARVLEECVHLIDLIKSGNNWYGTDEEGQRTARRDLRSTETFLKRVKLVACGD